MLTGLTNEHRPIHVGLPREDLHAPMGLPSVGLPHPVIESQIRRRRDTILGLVLVNDL